MVAVVGNIDMEQGGYFNRKYAWYRNQGIVAVVANTEMEQGGYFNGRYTWYR